MYSYKKIVGFLSLFAIISCDTTTLNPENTLINPIETLTENELKNYEAGKNLFEHSFNRSEGLGPLFISTDCKSCHFNGGKGHPFNEIVRYGKWNSLGEFENMHAQSGPQLQYRSIDGYPAETIPEEAEGIVHLNPPALAGLGFLEAIADDTLLSWTDENDLNNDGISGRVAFVNEPDYLPNTDIFESVYRSSDNKRIARFGKKAFSINLFQQTVRALVEDLGITTNAENNDPFNYKADAEVIFKGDEIENPELPDDRLAELLFFMRSTATPPRRNLDDLNVINGELLFKEIGCNKCHKDNITTGNTNLPFLNNKIIHPFTDLLLHDMGEQLDDGYTEGDAKTNEWRTPPLWGIGLTTFSQGGNSYYLHDGRVTTLQEAINLHGGEAENIKNNFNSLNELEKESVITFLKSL